MVLTARPCRCLFSRMVLTAALLLHHHWQEDSPTWLYNPSPHCFLKQADTLYIEHQHHGIYHAYSSHINRTFEPNARSQHLTGRRRVTPAATNSCHNVHGPKKYVSTAFTGNTNMKICKLRQNLFKFMRLHTNNRMETYGYPQHCTSMKLRACILAHEYP